MSGSTDSTANGLNQLASIGGGAPGYDDRGNLTYDPVTGRYFGYWSEGELVAASGGYGFGRDAFSRLIDTYANGFVGERFVYDGAEIVAETDGANIAGRYVRGDGPDELLAAYLTADPSSRRLVHADERGSVIAYTDSGGNATAINRYDEFGNPQAGNWGRFQYTGQLWLPQAGLYDYKFRAYDPRQGRFYQPDPIGYAGDGPNLYAYVLNDPVNFTDPLGLDVCGLGGVLVRDPSIPTYTDAGGAIVVSYGSCFQTSGSWGQPVISRPTTVKVGWGGGSGSRASPRQKEKLRRLPLCLQNFLTGRISSDVAAIRFYNGGSVWNLFDNSVTYGHNVYLTSERYPIGAAPWNKFHEIWHTSQNARFGFTSLHHAFAYVAFAGHDASPLENAADEFADSTLKAYRNAGLDKTCPF